MKRLAALILIALIGAGVWASHPKGADTPLKAATIIPAVPALQGPVKLAVIGTSLTADSTWPEEVVEQLQTCTETTLRRMAKGGRTSDWGLANITTLLDDPPDLAVIEFTINDADIRRRISAQNSALNHGALIDVLRKANPDVRIVLLRLNRAYGLRAMLRPQLSRYEQNLTEIAQTEDVDLLDLRPAWAKAGRAALTDGIHPAPEATSQLTTPALTTALAQLIGGDCRDTF